MPKSTSTRQPRYRLHKPSGQGVVTLNSKDYYLGCHGTTESKAAYDRMIAEWLANGRICLTTVATITVAAVIRQFWSWAETHYRKTDGTPTSEITQCRYALRPLNHLYGTTAAATFGPLKFKAVRQLLVHGYEHPKYGRQNPVSRSTANKWMGIVRRMFRWATENELVQASVFHSLLAVRGLQRGRTEARETLPVCPVPAALIDAVRPFVSRQVQAMIDLQLLTAARPGEICIMRGCDLDTSGRIWTYSPESHKNEHRGQRREIYLGPRAQLIVVPFLKTDPQSYLYNAAVAVGEHNEKRRQNRKTPSIFGHIRRTVKNRKLIRSRPSRDRYDVTSYRRAIARACEKGFPLPQSLAPKVKATGYPESSKEWKARLSEDEEAAVRLWRHDHQWYPHQLRHNAATNLRKEFGVELARIILGHANAFTTEIYAEADRRQAMEVIAKVG
jgi:integrase